MLILDAAIDYLGIKPSTLNFGMTVSSSAKPSSSFFSQPSTLATLASLGIHGLVFAFLPLFSSGTSSAETQPPEPVAVVELTPEQQQRLPDLERSPRSLLPSSPLNSGSFGLTPPPPNGDLFPGAGSFSSPSASRVAPSPISPGGLIGRRPSISSGFPTTRSIPGSVPVPRTVTPSAPSQPPQPQPTTPNTTTPTDPLATGTIGTSGRIPALDDLIARSRLPQSSEETNGTAEDLTPATPSASPSPSAPETSPSPDVETSDPGAENANPNGEVAASPSPSPSPATGTVAAEYAQLRELYTYNPDNTSGEAASQNMEAWLASLPPEISEGEDLNINEPIDLTIEYPLDSCLPGEEPRNASIGVVADANGELLAEPQLLRSTGYKGLNEEALSAVQNYQIPEAGGPQAYTFRVNVEYDEDSCLSSGESASAVS